jgi:hypothetical protein
VQAKPKLYFRDQSAKNATTGYGREIGGLPSSPDVCFWHLADNPVAPVFVRFWTVADNRRFQRVMVCPRMTQSGHARC